MKSVFDPSFKYRPSVDTNVRKTFERIRRQQLAQRRKQAIAANSETETAKVLKLGKR